MKRADIRILKEAGLEASREGCGDGVADGLGHGRSIRRRYQAETLGEGRAG